ncbi:hypothetical protein, partial [Aureimonas sp. Leaf324]|uniref:hypothetical protein n=1 Tax=Aureimonas sp. Leaf324 TaxID=1736336 RepID=UPI001AEC1279
ASAVQSVRPGATAVVDERLIGGPTAEGQQGNADQREKIGNLKRRQHVESCSDRQDSVIGPTRRHESARGKGS